MSQTPLEPPAETSRHDDAARRLRDLEALYAVSVAMSASPELREVLARALPPVLDAVGMPSGVIRRLDPATGELHAAALAGLDPETAAAMAGPYRANETPYGLAIQNRAVVVIPDLQDSPHQNSVWAIHGYRTFVAAPLESKGMVLGSLNMASREVRPFELRDRELMAAMLGQIALAIGSQELYASAQRKIRHLAALHQSSQDIGPAPDLERVLRLVPERFAQMLGLKRAAVLFGSPSTGTLRGGSGWGYPPGLAERVEAPLSALPGAAAVLGQQELVLSHEPQRDGLAPPELLEGEGRASMLALPLVAHDEVIGILVGDGTGAPLRLSSDELELGMIFANQASVWLAGARLFVQEQQARAEAEAARARYQELLELAPDAILNIDRSGRIRLMNTQAERMLGYSREELVGQLVERLLPGRYRGAHVDHREAYHRAPRTRPMGSGLDLYALRKDGVEIPVEISLSPAQGETVICVIRDITDRKLAAQEREELLRREQEKSEQLKLAVREAHHRIKNNLQAISDLLYLELAGGTAAGTEDVLQESVERIQSIALVHDLLSQEEGVETVDTAALAERLIPMALRSVGVAGTALDLDVEVSPVALSSKQATTLALILNELIANAAKHAFSGRERGRLEVCVQEEDRGLRVRVSDDGPGLPAGFDLQRDASVGLQVVRTLAERDLGGRFSLVGGSGVTASVWFPVTRDE